MMRAVTTSSDCQAMIAMFLLHWQQMITTVGIGLTVKVIIIS